jgi:hypothetical protein
MHILPIVKGRIIRIKHSRPNSNPTYYLLIPNDYVKNGLIDADTKLDAILITNDR